MPFISCVIWMQITMLLEHSDHRMLLASPDLWINIFQRYCRLVLKAVQTSACNFIYVILSHLICLRKYFSTLSWLNEHICQIICYLSCIYSIVIVRCRTESLHDFFFSFFESCRCMIDMPKDPLLWILSSSCLPCDYQTISYLLLLVPFKYALNIIILDREREWSKDSERCKVNKCRKNIGEQ